MPLSMLHGWSVIAARKPARVVLPIRLGRAHPSAKDVTHALLGPVELGFGYTY